MPQVNLNEFQIQILLDLVNFYIEGANQDEDKDMTVEEKDSAKIIDSEVRNIKDILEKLIVS